MDNNTLIDKVVDYVQDTLEGAEGGHDWWHIYRVWQMAKRIAKEEGADLQIVELGALLHDIADSKFHGGDEELGPAKARQFLGSLGIESDVLKQVETIVREISFKGGHGTSIDRSIEFQVVQDADRLDAIGAIGIARAFNYGGFKNRMIYSPDIAPNLSMSKEQYKKSTAPTINHFYEKLLLLKDKMNTKSGIKLAESRHLFMETYLRQFYEEWDAADSI